MQRLELEVDLRDGGTARRLRAEGFVPAIVYGSGVPATTLRVDGRKLERLVAHYTNALIDLRGPKVLKGRLVLIKELQRDPVSRRVLHCDFYAVDTEKKINVDVPVHFEGRAIGIEEGGILEPLLREIEVACLPLSIPDRISVNVEALSIGDSIHVGQLSFPEGVEPLVEDHIAVVHVAAPRVEEEPTPAEEVVEGEAAPTEEGEAPKTEASEAPESGD